jgi:hypothetical protein
MLLVDTAYEEADEAPAANKPAMPIIHATRRQIILPFMAVLSILK